ncbi:hypothetical protein [uncultured Spirosoma sp.]|uniref:hypothetical protein n=1 Tax=uncultured Spirosoma sp. TaxID=278208 RepID=UPI00258E7FD9|nr:hypothetical protein [uncultured Spirosoma sp.]
MLTLKLYPAELSTLYGFLSRVSRDQFRVPVTQQPLAVTVLLTYQAKLSISRVYAWRQRNTKRAYSFQLPVPVAKAFHQEMKISSLTALQQSLLDQIDLALTNYQPPQMVVADLLE